MNASASSSTMCNLKDQMVLQYLSQMRLRKILLIKIVALNSHPKKWCLMIPTPLESKVLAQVMVLMPSAFTTSWILIKGFTSKGNLNALKFYSSFSEIVKLLTDLLKKQDKLHVD